MDSPSSTADCLIPNAKDRIPATPAEGTVPSAPGEQPAVSVVVPVFNAERWLPETLCDLLGQTLRDAEFLFVDDGSTDGSLALLEKAAAEDPRVRVLRQERKFAGCARNLGIDAARGKWLIALDADDRFEPTLLEEAVRRGEETDAQIVLFDADELVMPEGRIVPRASLARASKLPTEPFEPSEDTYEAFRVTATWNKLFRADYVRAGGFRYQETFECNDIRFVLLSMAKASRVAALPRPLVHYRVGLPDSVQANKDGHPFDVVAAYASLRRELEREGLWERFHRVFATRAAVSIAVGRIAGFRSARAARDWYDAMQGRFLSELGLVDLPNDEFIGPDADNLRVRLRDFQSVPFDEWIWRLLHQYKDSGENRRRALSEARIAHAEDRRSLASAKARLARTEERLADAEGRLADAKGRLADAKRSLAAERRNLAAEQRARRSLRRSFSCRLGFALTGPVRFALSLFRRSSGAPRKDAAPAPPPRTTDASRKNLLTVLPSIVSGGRIVYRYEVSGEWADCFHAEKPFFVEYPFDLERVPESVRIVPFLSQAMPVAWVCDAEVRVPACDRDFHDCLEAVKGGYRAMYPMIRFAGRLSAERLETNRPAGQDAREALACFSGGVDAHATAIRHLSERPVLVSIWGSDVPWGKEDGWRPVEELIRGNAKTLGLESLSLRSSFRDLLDRERLGRRVRKSGDAWWHGFQHGLGITGHLAPVAWRRGAGTVFIASSFTAGDTYTCASDPAIDNRIRFCGAAVVHDGYEWNRQDKIRRIVEYASENGVRLPLHVCWKKKGGDNCGHCEKCWRTILALYAEGADPRAFGFPGFNGLRDLPGDMERDAENFRTRTAAHYRPIQSRLRSRLAERDVPAELLWLYHGDFAAPSAAT